MFWRYLAIRLAIRGVARGVGTAARLAAKGSANGGVTFPHTGSVTPAITPHTHTLPDAGNAILWVVFGSLALLGMFLVIYGMSHHGQWPTRAQSDPTPRRATQLVSEAAQRRKVRENAAAARTTTLRELQRTLRVLSVVATPCPKCHAPNGHSCHVTDGSPLVRLMPGAYAHHDRLAEAIKTGNATKDEIVAQFGNNTVPTEVMACL